MFIFFGHRQRHCDRAARRIDKLHAKAGLDVSRLGTLQVPHGNIGHTNQLPAAGAGTGVDRTEAAAQRHSACRHPCARRLAAWHLQIGSARQIDKTRCKTGKGCVIRLGGVALNELRHRHSQQLGHFGQILAGVVHGYFHQPPLPRYSQLFALQCLLGQ